MRRALPASPARRHGRLTRPPCVRRSVLKVPWNPFERLSKGLRVNGGEDYEEEEEDARVARGVQAEKRPLLRNANGRVA